MPFERFIWSLVAPLGFRYANFADESAFATAVGAGSIQDPRGGLGHMLYAGDVARPPIKINEVHTGGSNSYEFDVRQVSDGGPVTGFTSVSLLFPDGTVMKAATGPFTKVFGRNGPKIVRAVLNDGRSATLVVNVQSAGNPPEEDPEPAPPPTWAEKVAALEGDAALTAFMVSHGIPEPEGWGDLSFEEKKVWLLENEPQPEKTWAEIVATLVDDAADVASFVDLYNIVVPAKWSKWNVDQKKAWLEANPRTKA